MRILCIVPVGQEADYLHKGLTELAYSVEVARDEHEGLFACTEARYDALVIALPDLPDGLVARLGAGAGDASVLVITPDDSSTQRAAALRAGADACLSRPWSFMELQARLQALARRSPQPLPLGTLTGPGASADPDAIRLDSSSRSLVAALITVPLSRREYLVLECLMREANAAISRDQLLQYAWTADEQADASTINVLMSRLRLKLSAAGVDVPLETVPGHGYRYVCPKANASRGPADP
jgi:two-component system OmpR family response regulator